MSETKPQPRFMIRGQYIKDFSFENPHAPQSLMSLKDRPKIEVNVDLKSQRLEQETFDLTMVISVKASQDNKPLFLTELAYSGIFSVQNVPEQQLEPVLFIDCAFMLFPFARRVIADATRDGGFPPLLLDPIDFHTLYVQNKQGAKKAAPVQ